MSDLAELVCLFPDSLRQRASVALDKLLAGAYTAGFGVMRCRCEARGANLRGQGRRGGPGQGYG